MTVPDEPHAGETATETHHEPHGAAAPHGAADHEMDEHGEALGPLDIPAWAAGVGGVALGLIVAACLVIATSG